MRVHQGSFIEIHIGEPVYGESPGAGRLPRSLVELMNSFLDMKLDNT